MDAEKLASYMSASCTCRRQADAVRAAASKHQHYIDHVAIVSVTPTLDSPTMADVLVEYDAGPAGLADASGRQVTSTAAKRGVRRLIRLQLEGNRWLISEIDAA